MSGPRACPGVGHELGRECRHEETGAGSPKEVGGGDGLEGGQHAFRAEKVQKRQHASNYVYFSKNEIYAHLFLFGKCKLYQSTLYSSIFGVLFLSSVFFSFPLRDGLVILSQVPVPPLKQGSLLFFDFFF